MVAYRLWRRPQHCPVARDRHRDRGI